MANPINVLCKLIADVTGPDGKIRIPGFYDDVEEASDEERKLVASIPFNEEEYKKSIGVKALFGEEGYSTIERTGYRPSFDVCGIWGGYTGDGAKTVIPSKAYAKISSRLVPHQDHNKISQLVVDYFNRVAPDTVTVKVEKHHGGYGYVCPIDFPAYKAAEEVSRLSLESAHCLFVLVVLFQLSQPLKSYLVLRVSSWASVWNQMPSILQTRICQLISG